MVQDIASRLGRRASTLRSRLALLYFGVGDSRESHHDPVPWCNADDEELRDFYNGSRDRAVIISELRHKTFCVAPRLLEIIPRSQLCLTKACLIRSSLKDSRQRRSLTEVALGNLFATSSRVSTRVLCEENRFVFYEGKYHHRKLLPSRVMICSLGLVWEDELRGLSQIVLARKQRSRLHSPHTVPGEVARLILKCLALPLCLENAGASGKQTVSASLSTLH